MSWLSHRKVALSAALASMLIPAVTWAVGNAVNGWASRNVHSAWAEPVVFLGTVAGASALLVAIAVVLRRRSIAAIAWLVALTGASGVFALLIAVSSPLAMTTRGTTLYEPTPVTDRTAFAKTYRDLRGGFPGGGDYVVRHSWALDEYGIIPPEGHATGLRWVGYWEEYGLPFRCARSPLHFGLPRPDRSRYISLLPEMFTRIRLRPLGLGANTLLLALFLVTIVSLPRWVLARHRSQADCCPECGYFVRDLRRCPECGADVRRHRRGVSVVRSA